MTHFGIEEGSPISTVYTWQGHDAFSAVTLHTYRTTMHAYVRVCAHVAVACYTVPLDESTAAVSDVTRKEHY